MESEKFYAFIKYVQSKGKDETCIESFKKLAIYNDSSSIKALKYIYNKNHNDAEKNKWVEVEKLLKNDLNKAHIYKSTNFSQLTEAEEMAMMINCVSERIMIRNLKSDIIDKYLTYYIYNSKDSISVKLKNLIYTDNFYLKLNGGEETKVGF